jgi:predicted PurR-regulated permease PerM
MTTQRIEISSRTIVFTVFFLLGLGFLWQIRDLIFSLLIAFIISGALKPAVNFLESKKIPRVLATIVVYFFFVFVFFYLFTLIIPPLVTELVSLFKNLPGIIKSTLPSLGSTFNFDFFSRNLPSITNQTFEFIKGLFGNAIFISSTLFFGFYLLSERNLTHKLLGNFFEERELNRITMIMDRAQKRMSGWFWGEIILMLVVGSLTYVGLAAFKIKYALALAVLAGILEVIPNIGPILSAVPAVLIGLSTSPILGLSMVALYFIVQQLENNVVVPLIMKKVTGLHPIVILISLVIGSKLAGVIGVILAVPTTLLLETIIIEWNKMTR